MIKFINLYSKKELLLAFEFGLVVSEVAKDRKVTLTPEISAKAEEIFLNEIKINGLEKTAINFLPLVLASFEVK